ncbi:PBECR2 nuclease fold domain-containing protein, partial [Helicobacter suis]|uniref:putative barnase/colicin E5 family endoribonuclease n=1 Tax=Helicobacter suis TaxID=104628 RepID=UPI0023DDD191
EAFKQNLNRIANRAEFSNATRVLIREIEQNLPKSVESGGTQANMEGRGLQSQTQGAGQELEGRGLQDQGAVKIPHNPAFGQNFKEFYHDPKGAIAKLIETKEGQVAGAFYREDLGDIDLVWGEIRDQSGKLKGHGLSKIIEKHLDDFKGFEGNNAYEKLGNGLEEIVKNGKMVTDQAGIKTIILKKDNQEFRVGLTQGWKHEGKNYWIVTAYRKSPAQKFDQVAAKSGLGSDLAQKDKPHPTTPPLKSQDFNNYIDVEVIDHPKQLSYKSDGQIYKESKAKGLSYAEFKALRDQEKATRALHTTRYIEFKKAESQNIKDLLDPNKPLRMLKPAEITERLLDQIKKHNAKVWVGELKDLTLANQLKLDTNHPIKLTFNGSALAHVEKQHGNTSIHYLKNKQPPIGIQDVRDYPKVVNSADAIKLETTRDNQKALVAGKQINGYFIVVETISRKQNELKLKTMYKENGKLENSPIFKDSGLSSRLLTSSEDSLSPKPSVNLDAPPQAGAKFNTPALKNQTTKADNVQSLYAQWKNAFNLKNTNEPFIPKFAPEVKQALESVLQNEEIKLTQGSLYKLIKRGREELLPYIRPTLENPDMVLDNGRGILFIKEFIDPDKNKYFMSVAKNYNGEWVFSSHTRRELATIKKELANSKVLYNKGFKSGEVAGASDILKSGGTAMKPSDLQINTPPHPSSGLNPEKKISQESLKNQEQQKPKLSKEAAIDEATKDIDPKYLPENFGWRHFSKLRFYELWGKEGLNLKPSEAFYKPKFSPKVQGALEPLGYNIQFSQREIHNWGKSNLKEFKGALENPNVIIELDAGDSKFLTFIQKTPRGIERFSIEPTHEGFNLYDHLGRKFNLKETLQDERINLIFSNDPELTTLRPFNKAFGTNFEEFYHDPQGAVAKLIQVKKGQVAGAFYREDLGDIDLVWGEGGAKGYGLNKIFKKHLNDFIWFKGHTPKQKLASALEEIVQKGNLITNQAGIKTIWLKHEDEYYLVGLSKGWKGEGDNHWIITSYKKTHGEIPKEVKGNTANLSAYNDKFNPVLTSTDEPLTANNLIQNNIKNQEIPFEQLNQRMIKPEEFTDSVIKELKKRPKL